MPLLNLGGNFSVSSRLLETDKPVNLSSHPGCIPPNQKSSLSYCQLRTM